MPAVMTDVLLSEYETIVADVGENVTDAAIIAALVRDGDWTEQGAREVLRLAQMYGTSILRNALALASAMQIEDGEAGL
ncbi:hypothetical protein RAS1_09660 [Phycisphaerae bacterium RAS1]|nr:hypothetical protein RAS1_09660 [Phycisphaerae bacterium RAS1]